jgi:tRNA (mo5U34)-methyltransferase
VEGLATSDHRWYHTIDLPDGTTTAGFADARAARPYVEWPAELRGGRCLDVGTFDGFWAFEMERLGAAEVLALDIDDPEQFDWPFDFRRSGPDVLRGQHTLEGAGFKRAAAALGSSAERVCLSVYDLDPGVHGRFDVVACGELLLHLRDPIRALEAMREVCSGELVLIEGVDPLLDLVARGVPCARVGPEGDMWWRANSAGLVRMLDRAGFAVTWVGKRFLVPHGPGWRTKPTPLDAIAAAKPFGRGGLHRAFRGRPREPAGPAR